MNPRALGFLTILALVSAAPATRAQTFASALQPVRRTLGMRLEAPVGIAFGQVSGVTLGAGIYLRYWIFQLGAFYQAGREDLSLFGSVSSFQTAGGAAGVRLGPTRGPCASLDLLLTGGVHSYVNVGARSSGGIYSPTVHTVGVGAGPIPFIGGRIGGAMEWGRSVRFSLGGALVVEADLTRVERMQTSYPDGSRSCGWGQTCPTPTSTQSPVTLGGVQTGVLLTLGVVLDEGR